MTLVRIDPTQSQSCQGCGWNIVLAGREPGYCSLCEPILCPQDGTIVRLDLAMGLAICENGHWWENGDEIGTYLD